MSESLRIRVAMSKVGCVAKIGPSYPFLVRIGKSSHVIQMAMRQNHCVQPAAFQFRRTAVLAFSQLAALKQTAINQDLACLVTT